MKQSKILILTLIFFSKSFLYAGIDKGNGGDVVVCKNKTVLYDFYESEAVFGQKVSPEYSKIGDDALIINHLYYKLLPISKKVADFYFYGFYNFFETTTLIPVIGLPEIKNEDYLIYPLPSTGCKIKQVAINFFDQDITEGENPYLIDIKLFNNLNPLTRVALVLHEITFQKNTSISNKRNLREFITILFQEDFPFKNEKELFTLINELELNRILLP